LPCNWSVTWPLPARGVSPFARTSAGSSPACCWLPCWGGVQLV